MIEEKKDFGGDSVTKERFLLVSSFIYLAVVNSPLLLAKLPQDSLLGAISYVAISIIGMSILIFVFVRYNGENDSIMQVKKIIRWFVGGIIVSFILQFFYINALLLFSHKAYEASSTLAALQQIKSAEFMIIASAICIPIIEEIVFRYSLPTVLEKRLSWQFSLIISAMLFALLHGNNLIFYLLLGLWFGYLYHRTKQIWVPISVHVVMNLWILFR